MPKVAEPDALAYQLMPGPSTGHLVRGLSQDIGDGAGLPATIRSSRRRILHWLDRRMHAAYIHVYATLEALVLSERMRAFKSEGT